MRNSLCECITLDIKCHFCVKFDDPKMTLTKMNYEMKWINRMKLTKVNRKNNKNINLSFWDRKTCETRTTSTWSERETRKDKKYLFVEIIVIILLLLLIVNQSTMNRKCSAIDMW